MANIKNGFNAKKFEAERMGLGRGKMQWTTWRDVGWYYGLPTDPKELREGRMRINLYHALCHTFGREQMDAYFAAEAAPKPFTAQEQEIVELADMIVYGREKP